MVMDNDKDIFRELKSKLRVFYPEVFQTGHGSEASLSIEDRKTRKSVIVWRLENSWGVEFRNLDKQEVISSKRISDMDWLVAEAIRFLGSVDYRP